MRRRSAAALLGLAAAMVVGCGSEDFPNEQRPPVEEELSARIDDSKVVVSPTKVSAGVATITISNQSSDDVQLDFTGPSDRSTNPIPAGGVASVKFALSEGDYRVKPDVSSITSGSLSVGPPGPSAQNELLLP